MAVIGRIYTRATMNLTKVTQDECKEQQRVDPFCFSAVENDVQELKSITKESLLEFIEKYISPASPSIRKLSVHVQSQKVPVAVPKYKVDIESLHTCLVAQGVTRLGIDDLRAAVERGESGESSIQAILREMLIDETKAEESEIEALMTKLVTAMGMDTLDAEGDGMINGSFVTVDSKKTARRLSLKGDGDSSSGQSTPVRDHTKLPQGNTVIGDAVQFKTKMELSPAAVPLIDF